MVIQGQDIYVGFGPNVGENAVIAYNVGEFLTGNPKEIVVYNDNVNTGPTGIAFDKEGNVYIAEYTSATAVKYARGKGTKPLLVINQGTNGCEGIALDKTGNIYVSNADSNNITVYAPTGGAPIRRLE
jgi:DNA-binding beta-propeller fold protein YncE